MGESLSKEQTQHAEELYRLAQSLQPDSSVSVKGIQDLLREVECQCPWYPLKGTLRTTDWEKIGRELKGEPRAPVGLLLTWQHLYAAVCKFNPTDNPLVAVKPLPEDPGGSPPPYLYPALESLQLPSASAPPAPPQPQPPCRSQVARAIAAARKDGTMDPTEEWNGDSPALFPLTRTPNPRNEDEQILNWEALPYSVLREINKSIKDYGLKSSYCQGSIEGLSNGYRMLPQDWKDLFRMVLSPSQYVVWDSEYRAAALAGATADITAEQVYGSGQFAKLEKQLHLPDGHLAATAACIMRALRRVPVTDKPQKSFSAIRQGNSEPYPAFVDRLQEAIARQIDNDQAQNELLVKLAYENANTDCKRILTPIVHRQGYTLADMLTACAEVGSKHHEMALLAAALQGGRRPGTKPMGNCFNCNKPGHFRSQCRAPGGGAARGSNPSGSSNQNRPSKKCPKCQKGYHWANQCRSSAPSSETKNS